MNRTLICTLLVLLAVLCPAALVAQDGAGTRSILILPFDNASHQPTLSWVGEAFPEVVGQRLAAQSMYVVSREDRHYAFDRMGIPENLHASRATLYKIALQLDVDYILLGSFSYDGQTFTARAQLMDMKALRLSQDIVESGTLPQLNAVLTATAWDVTHEIYPDLFESKEAFVQRAPVIRLDAFESFIRGVVANGETERVRYLKAAIAIDPNYAAAILLLGRTHFNAREYEKAAEWLAKVPKENDMAAEASFFLGLSELHLGHFEKSVAAFKTTAEHVPLTEVLNNIGVAESRRGRPDAVGYFQKAVEADAADADYRLNLAVALYRHGDLAGAQHQLKECLARDPNDAEAVRFQQAIAASAAAHTQAEFVPQARIKSNYNESSYRQLAVELQNAIEASVDKAKPSDRAWLHIERARQFLASHANEAAESQFREALIHEPMNAAALSGLATALAAQGKFPEARYQAEAALRIHSADAEAYVVLARVSLHNNDLAAAAQSVQAALALDATNQDALNLQREIQDKSLLQPPAAK